MSKFTFEKLKSYKVQELREIAKTLNISGRWSMKKGELISAILGQIEETKSELKSNQISQETKNDPVFKKAEEKYLDNIEVGRLIAYHDKNGYARSARVQKVLSDKRLLIVKDIHGNKDNVSFDDVAWVKTGKRWPRKLFNALKTSQKIIEAIGGTNNG